jgi:carbon-monoxide dehydrogenase large subunit
LLGIGIAFEMTPEAADFPGTMVGGFDTSTVRIDPSGDVVLLTGITSPGTGNDTAVAQIVADLLGIDPEQVTVVQGDTDVCPYGFGNGNGRSTIMGGGSAHLAALDVRAKLATVAGALLGVAPERLEFAGGRVADADSGRSAGFSEVAYAAYSEAFARAAGIDPPLEATRVYRPGNIDHTPDDHGRIQPYTTFSNAVHVSVLDVDPETGRITLLRHAVVDDCGTMINPLAVAGQMHGAIAMGIGGALSEELGYDAAGHLLATGFKTYLTPRASDVPRIELAHQVTPSPFTVHGEKGAGEAGVGGSIAAILNAANDALSPLGITLRSLPLTAENVRAAIASAGAA